MNAEYTVFIDESFYQWFGLPTKESNLCYGALSVPTERLDELVAFENSVRQFAFDQLPEVEKAKRGSAEVKYADFRHFPPEAIDIIGQKFGYFLAKNRAAIFGFFIAAQGFMNYVLRSDYYDKADALRATTEVEHAAHLEKIRAEMLKKWEDAEHDIGLLTELYGPFFNFLVQYHGRSLKKTYRVVYDSRNPEEDAQLHRNAEQLASVADRLHPGTFAHYKGYVGEKSHNSPGLRLVDWVAGEVRSFFYRNPAVLSGDSKFDILSPCCNPRMILLDGKPAPYYRKGLSREASGCFDVIGKGFMLPRIKDSFAEGLLTCYATHGEARHISIRERAVYDMAD